MKTKSIILFLAIMFAVPMFGQTFAITVYEDCDKNGAIKSSTGGIVDGREYVDLGLSVYWATTNIGASAPEEKGDYYAWGETYLRSSTYTWDNYRYGNIRSDTDYRVKKYCTIDAEKYNAAALDNRTQLLDEDDAAHVCWGGDWHMPTRAQAQELVNNCNWEWTSLNGVNGYRITSKVTGYTNNSIFLPVTGYIYANKYDTKNTLSGSNGGYYWLSELNSTTTSHSASSLCLGSSSYSVSSLTWRSYGSPIRPVMSKGL